MGASVSLRGNNGLTKEQREDQAIAGLLLVISKNVFSMEQLVNQIDSCKDIEELKDELNEKQNHILKLIKEANIDIGQLAYLDGSEKCISPRKLQNRRRREQYQKELKDTLKKFQYVQKLAAEKEDIMMGHEHQDMKNALQTVGALILIITKKVHLMKQIIHQLTMIPENMEELLNQLYEIDHYTGLLISDASDCIKKQADGLIPDVSINPNQDRHLELELENGISMLHDVDGLLSSLQMLHTEKQTVMTKVNEFKKQVLRKNKK